MEIVELLERGFILKTLKNRIFYAKDEKGVSGNYFEMARIVLPYKVGSTSYPYIENLYAGSPHAHMPEDVTSYGLQFIAGYPLGETLSLDWGKRPCPTSPIYWSKCDIFLVLGNNEPNTEKYVYTEANKVRVMQELFPDTESRNRNPQVVRLLEHWEMDGKSAYRMLKHGIFTTRTRVALNDVKLSLANDSIDAYNHPALDDELMSKRIFGCDVELNYTDWNCLTWQELHPWRVDQDLSYTGNPIVHLQIGDQSTVAHSIVTAGESITCRGISSGSKRTYLMLAHSPIDLDSEGIFNQSVKISPRGAISQSPWHAWSTLAFLATDYEEESEYFNDTYLEVLTKDDPKAKQLLDAHIDLFNSSKAIPNSVYKISVNEE